MTEPSKIVGRNSLKYEVVQIDNSSTVTKAEKLKIADIGETEFGLCCLQFAGCRQTWGVVTRHHCILVCGLGKSDLEQQNSHGTIASGFRRFQYQQVLL